MVVAIAPSGFAPIAVQIFLVGIIKNFDRFITAVCRIVIIFYRYEIIDICGSINDKRMSV